MCNGMPTMSVNNNTNNYNSTVNCVHHATTHSEYTLFLAILQ